MSAKNRVITLKISPKLKEMGFTEIYSLGNMLILRTNTQEIICKLDHKDLIKTTEKYLKKSLDRLGFSNQDKEVIITNVCDMLLESKKKQCNEERDNKQREQQATQNIHNEINQLREQNTGITPEQWQSKLEEKLQNLITVVDSTMPEIWPGLEFELSVLRILDLEDCDLPFIGIILGRPSSYKTVIISILKGWIKTFYTDIFTARSFVSHSTAVNSEEELQEIDLLPKIKDKLFLTPELSPLFTSKEEDLMQLMGIITRVADGHGLSSDSGAHGHRGYDGDYMFTWVGAAVDIPYKVYKILQTLGPRMYFFRMKFEEQTPEELEKYAIEDRKFSDKVSMIKAAFYDYLKWCEISPMMIPKVKWDFDNDSKEALKYIAGISDLLSFLRCTAVVWETSDTQGSEYGYTISQREKPTRAISHLKNFARGHALLTGRNHITLDDIPMIIKTALDTASIERVSLFSLLIANNGSLTTDQILESLNVARKTALRTMAEFKAIGLVTVKDTAEDRPGRPSKMMVLNPRFDWFLEDELITKIIPHTHTEINSTGNGNGNGNGEGMQQQDLFWKTYDQLQEEEAANNIREEDKQTVNGKKLEERLISTGQFYNDDAAKMIKEMVRVGKLKEVMMDTYMRT
jgi:hypothetical protein